VIEMLHIFFAKANQRKRKKIISSLEDDGAAITDNKRMLEHAVVFIKPCLVEKISRWMITYGRRMRRLFLRRMRC
jgi:hypothetical protein